MPNEAAWTPGGRPADSTGMGEHDMRIHTRVDRATITAAAELAGVGFERLNEHGSRKAPRAFDVILTGNALHNCHWTRSGEYRAATWDEWGVFIAAIYRADHSAVFGGAYASREHFHWATGERFWGTFDWSDHHPRHKWEYNHHDRQHALHECSGCGAERSYLLNGTTWADMGPHYLIAEEAPLPTVRRTSAQIAADVAELRRELDADGFPYPSPPEYGATHQAVELVAAGGDMPPAAPLWTRGVQR